MIFSNFVDMLLKELEQRYPDWQFDIRNIHRANGVISKALVILPPDQPDGVSTAVYLDSLSRSYEEGVDLNILLQDITHCFDHFSQSPALEDYHNLYSYESMESHISFRIINPGENRNLLHTVPHRIIGEFAVIYYLIFFSGTDTCQGEPYIASTMITNRHLALWSVTEADLFSAAMKQTPELLPPYLSEMFGVLEDICSPAERLQLRELPDCPLWVLTNTYRVHGAACILYPGLLAKCAERLGGNFYILPSSVHEVILIPVHGEHTVSRKELLDMVCEINHTAVLDEERLADNVYLYDQETGYISSE